jgi:hypothetical protein
MFCLKEWIIMNQLLMTRKEMIDELNVLPPELLPELQAFIEFLRFKSEKTHDQVVGQTRQEMWQAALEATFGMWADRDDIAEDGVIYVQNIRRGHRLNDLLEQIDEAD